MSNVDDAEKLSIALVVLLIGWVLGFMSSLVTIWLEGRRENSREARKQRLQDIRAVRDWAHQDRKGRPSFRQFDLAGANLSGKNLADTDLEGVSLKGAGLWDTNFSKANLIDADFRGAQLIRADLSGADLHSADFAGAELTEVNFSGARLRRTRLKHAKKIERCIWQGALIDETTELPAALRAEIHGSI